MKLKDVATLLITGAAIGIVAVKLLGSEKDTKASKKLLQKAKKYKKILGEQSTKKPKTTNPAKENIKNSGSTKTYL